MKEQTRQPSDCTICGSMKLTLLKDRVTKDPILSPDGMKIYRCEKCKGLSNEFRIELKKGNKISCKGT